MDISTSLYSFFALWFLASIVGAIVTAAVDAQHGEAHHPIPQH
jgi:hypothetical protein